MSTSNRLETSRLADQLERAFWGGPWHGPAVREAVEGVDAEAAFRRSIAAAHTIWEITGHVAAWIDVARRRIEGEAVHDLPAQESWPAPPAADAAAWAAQLERLEAAHVALHATVLGLDDERLEDPVSGSDPTIRGLLLGVLQHNAYHAGQIVLLRKAEGLAAP